MKIKSHKSNWAMALCAVAVFSFTLSQQAQAGLRPGISPDPAITPPAPIATDVQRKPLPRIVPLPIIKPTLQMGTEVQFGTFTGKVVTG